MYVVLCYRVHPTGIKARRKICVTRYPGVRGWVVRDDDIKSAIAVELVLLDVHVVQESSIFILRWRRPRERSDLPEDERGYQSGSYDQLVCALHMSCVIHLHAVAGFPGSCLCGNVKS